MTTLIVDDDPRLRAHLQHVIPGETRTASSIAEGIFEAGSWQPSVILLDIRFANDRRRTGIDAIGEFQRACPRAKIVVMSTFATPADEIRALRLGAFAYHEKGDDETLSALVLVARTYVASVVPEHGPEQ